MTEILAIGGLLLAWKLLAQARKPEPRKIPLELRHPARDWGRYDLPTYLRRRRNP